MRSHVIALSAFLALAMAGMLLAHEGHAHKVMGTVTVADAKHIEVKTSEGKTVAILIGSDTKYLKGTGAGSAADLKVGARVVVDAVEGENEQLSAKAVRLGETHEHKP